MEKNQETVLVTGGAGFIGSHTVEALLAKGYKVRVLDNLSSGNLANLPLRDADLEFVEGDVRERDTVLNAAKGCDACIHLAAQVSVQRSFEEPTTSAMTNIVGFLNVREAALRHRMRRVVYASSAAVYGNPQQLPLDETAQTKPLSPYGIEKLVTEQYAMVLADNEPTRYLGLRYFNVYGPRQDPTSPYSGVISKFCDRFAARRRPTLFGDGRQTRDFIYVKDVAAANVAALGTDHQGAMNVCTGTTISLLQLIETLGNIYGVLPEIEFEPGRHGDIRHSSGSNSRLTELLGVTPQWTLQDGLSMLVEHDRQTKVA